MTNTPTPDARPELGPWYFAAAVLLVGLGLFFAFAPRSEAPARPAAISVW